MVAPALSSARAGTHTAKFICAQCQGRLPARRSFSHFRTLQKDNLPFSEKIRRKIWGTDNPPGQTNPYDSSIEGRSRWNSQPGSRTELPEQTIKELDEAISVRQPVPVEEDKPRLYTRRAAQTFEGYVPAESSIGLRVVKGEKISSAKERWDEEHPFTGFAARIPKTGNDAITVLSQVIAEAAIATEAGIPLNKFFDLAIIKGATYIDPEDITWRMGDNEDVMLELDNTARWEAVRQFEEFDEEILDDEAMLDNPEDFIENETEELKHETEETLEFQEDPDAEVLETAPLLKPEDVAAKFAGLKVYKGRTSHSFMPGGKTYAPTEAMSKHRLLNGETGPWSRISLADPDLKFAVFKRFAQLSGKRLPDQVLDKVRRVQDLLVWLHEASKPTKIAETLLSQTALSDLPNVTVWAKRVHPMEKEEAVGRLKVIDKAFEERGLVGQGVIRRRERLAREEVQRNERAALDAYRASVKAMERSARV